MITTSFLKGVLNGSKNLLEIKETQAIPQIPRYAEIDTKKMWDEIRGDNKFSRYFPDSYCLNGNVPNRTYFFTVF